ncbi:MAG: hypothetical protein K8T25_16570 [Planctomycetia bacterium]|nr:hypothetical protein [Planctomycetia bacterium]
MVWQTYLRDWLLRTAEARLRAAMSGAAKDQAAADTELLSSEEFPSSHLAVIVSTPQEAGGLVDRLDGMLTTEAGRLRVHEGGLSGRRVAVVVAGDAPETVADATEAILAGHRPQWVVVAGFATALLPQLTQGDAVLANSLVRDDGTTQSLDLPSGLLVDKGWHVGRVASIASPGSDAAARLAIGKRLSALATDRQTWAAAEVSRRQQVPCVSLGVIRHALDQREPQAVSHLRKSNTLAGKIGALAGIALNQPSGFGKLWTEKEQDLVATDRLAKYIDQLVDHLVPLRRRIKLGGA